MKNPKSLIIKIALGVAAAAFLFSIVTLIRNIVIGAMVFISVIQVIGAGVIVVICFAMLRVFSGMDEEEEAEEEKKEIEPDNDVPIPENYAESDPSFDEFSDLLAEDAVSEEDYDLQLFDE